MRPGTCAQSYAQLWIVAAHEMAMCGAGLWTTRRNMLSSPQSNRGVVGTGNLPELSAQMILGDSPRDGGIAQKMQKIKVSILEAKACLVARS